MKHSLSFVSSSALRKSLQSDIDELARCFENAAWKSVHVLAGSSIETLVLDALEQYGTASTGKAFDAMTLGELLNEAQKQSLLSDRSQKLSEVVKDYRNLLHPGRSRKFNDTPTKESAEISKALVSMIVFEIERSFDDGRIRRAEQVLRRLEHAPSTVELTDQHLVDLSQDERERLLTDVLMEWLSSDDGSISWRRDVASRFSDEIIESMGDESRRAFAAKLSKLLRSGNDVQMQHLLDAFFRPLLLAGMTQADRQYVLAYLRARFRSTGEPLFFHANRRLLLELTDDELGLYVIRPMLDRPLLEPTHAFDWLRVELGRLPATRLHTLVATVEALPHTARWGEADETIKKALAQAERSVVNTNDVEPQ